MKQKLIKTYENIKKKIQKNDIKSNNKHLNLFC